MSCVFIIGKKKMSWKHQNNKVTCVVKAWYYLFLCIIDIN